MPEADGDKAQLLSLNTASGMPESFHFRYFRVEDGTLAVGSPEFDVLERMRVEVLSLNREAGELNRKLSIANAELAEKNTSLVAAMQEVKMLSGLLPICSGCKRIRNDKGTWEQVEVYIEKRSGATFSHGLCPTCSRAYFPGV